MEPLNIEEKDYFQLYRSVIKDVDEYDSKACTVLLFQMFHDAIASRKNAKTLTGNLDLVKKYSGFLFKNFKFDSVAFKSLMRTKHHKLPVELCWWLHDNNILPLGEYLNTFSSKELVDLIKNLSKSNKSEEMFDDKTIAKDIFITLMCGAFMPQYYIRHIHYSLEWKQKCEDAIDELINKCIENMMKEKFLYFLSNEKLFLKNDIETFSVLYKIFFHNMLKKLMISSSTELCDIYSAYSYQYLFTTKHMTDQEHTCFKQIFRFMDLNDITNLIESYDNKINFKYTLFALSTCLHAHPQNEKKLQEIVINFLDDTFKGGKPRQLMKAFLFIRQASMESQKSSYYNNWYSKMFGTNAIYKTSTNTAVFTYFMQCLNKLIPYEPAHVILIHLNLTIRAPPKYQSLVFDYKSLCRSRIAEIKLSPAIQFDNLHLPVIYIFEECLRLNTITTMLKDVIRKKNEDYRKKLLPYLYRQSKIYVTVKEMLIDEGFLTESQLDDIKAPTTDCIHILDELEEMFDFVQ